MSERHPSEADLALFAGGDCGRLRQFLLNRHVARCGDCRDTVASFREVRSEVKGRSPVPLADWDRMALEMRGNIRVGLAAGECVREVPAVLGWKPRLAVGAVCVVMLAGAGVFLRSLLPHETVAGVARAAVLETTGAGVEIRTDTGGSMTLLKHGDVTGDRTVTSQGAVRARYVDGNTGTVTVTSVYVE